MHTTDQLNQFIDLRAHGMSVPKIAELLGVPPSTLYDWNRRERDRLQTLKQAIFEETEERIMGTPYRQLEALARALKAVDDEIVAKTPERAQFQNLPDLIRMAASLRRQLHSLRLHALAPPPDSQPPADPNPKP